MNQLLLAAWQNKVCISPLPKRTDFSTHRSSSFMSPPQLRHKASDRLYSSFQLHLLIYKRLKGVKKNNFLIASVLPPKLYILLQITSLKLQSSSDWKTESALVSETILSVNTHNGCVSIKALSKPCKRDAHQRTASNRAGSWRIAVFRWLKKNYEGNFHRFRRFLSPEKDSERNNQKPVTLTVRELYELRNPSPHKDAWERGNEILFMVALRNRDATLLHAATYSILSHLCLCQLTSYFQKHHAS